MTSKKKQTKKPAEKKKKIGKKPAKKAAKKTTKSKKPVKKKRQTKSAKTVTKPIKTYIAMVLDKSSSMDSIRAEAIEHFNEQVEQIIADSQGLDTKVSLTIFNQDVEEVFFNEDVSTLKPLTLKTYRPSGMTAMIDAVGQTIDRLELNKDIKDENVAVLVVIVSDGLENASKRYTRADLADRIQALQGTKRWTFTYLGANQDLAQIANDYNIPVGNITAFVADADGMKNATVMSVNSTSSYLSERRQGITQSTNYYKP
jgi:hypothetical protein